MDRPQARIVHWAGASPQVEHVESDGSLWYTRATYRDRAGRRVDLCLLPKRGSHGSAGGGTRATDLTDAKRLAVTLAVDILYEAQPDPAAFRPTAAALLSGDDISGDWQPTVLRVNASATAGTMRTAGAGAWTAAAELPDHYLAVSGASGWSVSTLDLRAP